MRVRNISTVPVVAAGLAIPPGRIGKIPAEQWTEWLGRSTGNKAMAATKLRVEDDVADTPAPADDGGGGDDTAAKTAELPADKPKPKPKR